MGLFSVFKKVGKAIGKGGKAVGKGAWWGLRRPELRLAAPFIPGGAIITEIILPVVKSLEAEDKSGAAKMAKAMRLLAPTLIDKLGLEDKAQIRMLIEIAIQIARGKASLK